MSKNLLHTLLIAATVAVGAATSAYAANPVQVGETAKGKTLVDAKGRTLYTFDKDSGGKSVCNGGCAVNWPPVSASADASASSSCSTSPSSRSTASSSSPAGNGSWTR